MNFDKYTERARGFPSGRPDHRHAREGHQQFAPEHLLKALLDDDQGLATGLIDRAGGDAQCAAPPKPR
jgi:ATP-dependent Clp protease ATP-binding subunit ClpB